MPNMKNFTTNRTMCFTTIDPNKDRWKWLEKLMGVKDKYI
jgi:hypothetical protein